MKRYPYTRWHAIDSLLRLGDEEKMSTLNRRQLLTSSAAVAVTAISPMEAQGHPSDATSPFTVRAGTGRPGGQWLVHGEKAFSVKVSGTDVGRKYAVLEIHTPPGLGPELHIHPGQNELFYLLKGSIGLQCGSDRIVLRAGDSFMAPADIPHAYVTLGDEPAHMLNLFDPAAQAEAFFADYAPLVDVKGQPDGKKLAEVYIRHGLKVVGPPLTASSFAN